MAVNLHEIPKFRDRLSFVYVEYAAIDRDANTIAFFDDSGKTQVPVATLSLLMLGPGTRISHAAIGVLSRANCLVAWCGEESVRMYAFGSGGAHSSARLLRQAELVSDPAKRLETARLLYQMRFPEQVSREMSVEQLRGKEGLRVRKAYEEIAARYGIEWERREHGTADWDRADPVNRAVSAANSCLYGVCHAAILSMGLSPALGFIHTGRQMSFVYDVADLYKIDIALPVAFREVAQGADDLEPRVRRAMRDAFRESRLLERIAEDLLRIIGPDPQEEDIDPAGEAPHEVSRPPEGNP